MPMRQVLASPLVVLACVAAVVVSFVAGCPSPKCPQSPDVAPWSPDDDLPTEGAGRNACAAAGAKLAELKCQEARSDFVEFCTYQLRQKLPFRPVCISKIRTCEGLRQCRTN